LPPDRFQKRIHRNPFQRGGRRGGRTGPGDGVFENYDRINAIREYTAFHKVLESMTAPNRLDKQA